MALTVVRDGEKDWYSSGDITPEPAYKYLYIVEHPGVQRVYFHNILSQNEDYQGYLYIEAEHFETMKRVFTYSNNRNSITVEGLRAYNANGGGIEGYSEDELILYRLVPQKRHANVQFDLQLRNKTGDDLEDDQQGSPSMQEKRMSSCSIRGIWIIMWTEKKARPVWKRSTVHSIPMNRKRGGRPTTLTVDVC